MYIVHPQTWLIFQAAYKKPDMEFINQTFQVPKRGRRLGGWVILFLIFSAVVLGDSQIHWLQRHAGICESEMTVSSFFGGIQRVPPKWRWKKRSHVFPKWRNLFFQGSFSGFIAFGVQTLGFQCLEIPLHGFRHLCFSQWKKETKETVVGNGVFYRIFTKNLLEMSQELSKRLGSVGYKL